MTYTSASYFVLVIATFLLYYALPMRFRWLALALGSTFFWVIASQYDLRMITVFLASILCSYLFGLVLAKMDAGRKKKLCLASAIALSAAPLIVSKLGALFANITHRSASISWIVPLGLSFYTMQMIAYLVDIYRGQTAPEKNVLKYYLFISFFPQLIQGPIPRWNKLGSQLLEGHTYDSKNLTGGIQLILWGFFLKYMIADKAAAFINPVFASPRSHTGSLMLVAVVLYSLQLYCDFMSCVSLSRGSAQLFGISLENNFSRPYFATSIKDFWRRWHISFSSWLRDYLYIPLGGNRKGRLRKYLNILITFLVSGLWHGANLNFIIWGAIHGCYQIFGELTSHIREKLYRFFHIDTTTVSYVLLKRFFTFALVCVGWIFFRASSLSDGLYILSRILLRFDIASLFTGGLYRVGLSRNEWTVLLISIAVLAAVSHQQEKDHISIRERFQQQPTIIRWIVYWAVICFIIVYGTYGWGYSVQDFIYGGF